MAKDVLLNIINEGFEAELSAKWMKTFLFPSTALRFLLRLFWYLHSLLKISNSSRHSWSVIISFPRRAKTRSSAISRAPSRWLGFSSAKSLFKSAENCFMGADPMHLKTLFLSPVPEMSICLLTLFSPMFFSVFFTKKLNRVFWSDFFFSFSFSATDGTISPFCSPPGLPWSFFWKNDT